jgi:hypothetical protein
LQSNARRQEANHQVGWAKGHLGVGVDRRMTPVVGPPEMSTGTDSLHRVPARRAAKPLPASGDEGQR